MEATQIILCVQTQKGTLGKVVEKESPRGEFIPRGVGAPHMKGVGMLVGNFELNP